MMIQIGAFENIGVNEAQEMMQMFKYGVPMRFMSGVSIRTRIPTSVVKSRQQEPEGRKLQYQ